MKSPDPLKPRFQLAARPLYRNTRSPVPLFGTAIGADEIGAIVTDHEPVAVTFNCVGALPSCSNPKAVTPE